MSDAILVNPQHPLRSSAAKRFRRRLHHAAGDNVVASSVLIQVFVVSRYYHTRTQLNLGSSFINGCIFVRQTKNVPKKTVEIGPQSPRCCLLICHMTRNIMSPRRVRRMIASPNPSPV